MKKTAVVTGAARGIGRAIAIELARRGFTVVSSARSEISSPHVSEFLSELNKISPESIYVQCDISDEGSAHRLIDTAFEKFGRIDVLVNNAGIAPDVRDDILKMTRASMEKVLSVNLFGMFFLTQYAANMMISHSCGEAIINITSMSAYTSSTSRGEYCISKAGASMATLLFADRLSEYGINVYEIRPGIIETDMTAGVKGKYEEKIDGGLLPIKRMGEPRDVALAVSALASGALPYSTGEVINIDGGFHIRRL